jgi:hypothetical protein
MEEYPPQSASQGTGAGRGRIWTQSFYGCNSITTIQLRQLKNMAV